MAVLTTFFMLGTSSVASSGCWECEYDVGLDAFVCVGLNVNDIGWTHCAPQYASEFEWCKFSGTYGPCTSGQGPCPGCKLYPVLPSGDDPPMITTQVMLYSLEEGAGGGRYGELDCQDVAGLDPSAAQFALESGIGHSQSLAGYSVQSSRRLTVTRYRSANDGIIFVAHPVGQGFMVDLYRDNRGAPAQLVKRVRVGAQVAGLISIELDGKVFLAVVHSIASPYLDGEVKDVVAAYHEPFMSAAQQIKPWRRMPLAIDVPPARAVGLDSWAIRSVTTNALAVSLSTGVRHE